MDSGEHLMKVCGRSACKDIARWRGCGVKFDGCDVEVALGTYDVDNGHDIHKVVILSESSLAYQQSFIASATWVYLVIMRFDGSLASMQFLRLVLLSPVLLMHPC